MRLDEEIGSMRAPRWVRVACLLCCFTSRPVQCLQSGLLLSKNRIPFRSRNDPGPPGRGRPSYHVGFASLSESSSSTLSSDRWRLYSSRRPPPSLSGRHSGSSLSKQPRFRLVRWLRSAWEPGYDTSSEGDSTGATVNATLSPVSAQQEADRLRERALRLRAEVRVLEVELNRSKAFGASHRQRTMDDMMHQLFPENATSTNEKAPSPQRVAQVLRDERWSVDQAVQVLEALYQRRKRAATIRIETLSSLPMDVPAKSSPSSQPPNRQVVMLRQDEGDLNYTVACVESLLEAASLLDSEGQLHKTNARWSGDGRGAATLKSRWNEWTRNDTRERERQLNVAFGGGGRVGRAVVSPTQVVNETSLMEGEGSAPASPANRGLAQILNGASAKETSGFLPAWVPPSVVPYVVAARASVHADDVKLIKDKVLASSSFFCTSTETSPSAALFRGNVRGPDASLTGGDSTKNVTATVWNDIQQSVDKEGISDRVQLFFLSDPEWKVGKDPREPLPRPVVLAVSKLVRPDDSLMNQSVLKTVLKRFSYVAALTTGLVYSVRCMALNEGFFNAVMTLNDAASLRTAVPIMAGLLGVQAVHELAHLLVARRNGIKTGFPVPLPSLSIALFGCITPLRSFPSTRTALFDVAISGPLSALLLSVGLMGYGVLQTVRASKAVLTTFPFVPVSLLKASLLSGSILSFLAPKVMMMPMSQPVPISPWFMVGFAGSIASALNLLPIYRLDGGRACAAAMGQRFAAVASTSSLLFLLSISFNPDSYGAAFWWAMAVVLFQRKPEIPARNDVTEIDEYRVGTWLTSLAASILTLAPFPGANGIL